MDETPKDQTPKPGGGETPAAKPEPARHPRRPRPAGVVLPALLASLLVALALGVGAALAVPYWLPKAKALLSSPASPDPRVAALEARVKALEERAGESPRASSDAPLSGRPPPAPPPAPTPASSAPIPSAPTVDKAALDELVRRLGESESRAADLARRLQAVEAAEAKAARSDPTAPALALAVGQLRDASLAGRPFARELDSLREIAKSRTDLAEAAERLRPFAAKGVPTVAALKGRFDGVARAVTIAARGEGDGTWTGRALARLAALVAVRRTDERAAEGTPDAVLRAAEQALARDDVGQAVAALETLAGPAQAAAQGWFADARARSTLDAALADLHRRALAALSGGG
jgi:uroporphyrinogen-III synthase